MFEVKKETFSEREARLLNYWRENKTFSASVENRKNSPTFTIYDGPPFATGLPHYGHLLAGTIKDVIPRYMTMKGYHVPRRFGWDCHGLPVENEIEKTKALTGASSIESFGIAKFNEECRSIVMRYTGEWKETVEKMGRWVSFEDTWKTMDLPFMESVWWVFSELWKKGLVYEGFKVMPFSAKLGTPLSNFEANLNYKEVQDPSLTVQFPLEDEPGASLLVWTTTPWTLLSNLAIIVHPELDYLKVRHRQTHQVYYVAKSRFSANFKEEDDYEIVKELKGESLKGRKYHPLFDLFVDQASPNAFHILTDEFVGDEDGTGLVHAAPAFGEVDFFVCQREGIEIVCPVDQNGRFTAEIAEYEGQFVKDADKDIIKRLKERGLVFNQSTIMHRYPFCWRSDKPLIYKAVSTWFVEVEAFKDRLVKNNEQIHWVPGHLKKGRFGKWLENARDWAISRNRYWGTPIPIWMAEDGDTIVISSKAQLEELTGETITDLHRHFIDQLEIQKDGKTYRRITEVFDCWFESGSMPYAQNHFPFENEEETLKHFPADFIAEGLDQTRGWFYTLNLLSTALFDKPAFKNVIVNGILLAEDGNKMSKSLRNYPDPNTVIDKYGADSIRLYFLNSPVVEADDLRFSERGVELVLRQFMIPLLNSYVFFATYANIYGVDHASLAELNPEADIDKWILSKLQILSQNVQDGMSEYKLTQAVKPFVEFIEQLTNWYIRRCRSRFWSDDDTPDRRQAFATLHRVLLDLSKIAAPFVPFLAEDIYQKLKAPNAIESVHLCNFPEVDQKLVNETVEQQMDLAQVVVTLGHSLRKDHKIKVRQPLASAMIVSKDQEVLEALKSQTALICDELNLKDLEFQSEASSIVSITCKPNFPVLGKKVGKHMKALTKEIMAFDDAKIQTLSNQDSVTIEIDAGSFTITPEDVMLTQKVNEGCAAAFEGDITVILNTKLNDDLVQEGHAREIVNKINQTRKAIGLEVTDRIRVTIDTNEELTQAFNAFKQYICEETLIVDVAFSEVEAEPIDINGIPTKIKIEK